MSPHRFELPISRAELWQVFGAASSLGLITGLLESSLFTMFRLAPDGLTWFMREQNVSLDFLWIAPLVNLVLFNAIAAMAMMALVLVRIATPVHLRLAADLFVLALLAVAASIVLTVPQRLNQWAILTLSLGVAVRLFAWFRRRPERRRWFGRGLRPLLLTVFLMAAVIRGGSRFNEWWTIRSLPEPPANAVNVLLVVLDTVRADHLSPWGYARPTGPNLKRIAEEGVLFDWAISPSAWTLPAHASVFTGRHVYEHRADSERPYLDGQYPTLAEVFAKHGFVTAGFSANSIWATRGAGLDRGFVHFEDYFGSLGDAVRRTVLGRGTVGRVLRPLGSRDMPGRQLAGDVSRSFETWLANQSDRPFFAFLNYFDAHAPYVGSGADHTMFMTERERVRDSLIRFPYPPNSGDLDATSRSYWTAAYDGGLAGLDSEIGRLLDLLRKNGRLDQTLVVITSDHGEGLADHGLYGHGYSLGAEMIRVPLILRLPGSIPAGVRVAPPVSTIDVAATILALEPPSFRGLLPGSSLSRFWTPTGRASVATDDIVFSEVGHRGGVSKAWPISAGRIRSIVEGDWHFIEHEIGKVELYNLRDDPGETNDVSGSAMGRDLTATFQARLREKVAAR